MHPVSLIGAGPGDPDLLTVKAARLLGQADVVVYDRLVSEAILDLAPDGATRIFAGKASRHHHMPQEDINELLATLALGGQKVVRLKGGDPFVFGRGSEEALHLAARGVPFEVVPGITAASGCTTYAGVPLTHRGLANGVRFVTGHRMGGHGLDLNWASLADPDTTLVIYMGLTNVAEISDKLMEHGMPRNLPVAAIQNGTTDKQRTVITTLADLPDCVASMSLKAPTLLVLGRVVGLAEDLDWRNPVVACDLEQAQA
ncbi:MAG: uroporphyrinogen-III C-methyltransferase [Rhodobacterales bacterium]|nr:uroporphyrinogen-III C-methyltransferase [Rhodobacterales bacterium]